MSSDNQLNGFSSNDEQNQKQQNGYSKSPKVKTIKLGSTDNSRPSDGPSFSQVLAKSTSRHKVKKEVKQEPITPVKMSYDDDEEDRPLTARIKEEKNRSRMEDDDEEAPLDTRMAKRNSLNNSKSSNKRKHETDDEEDEEYDDEEEDNDDFNDDDYEEEEAPSNQKSKKAKKVKEESSGSTKKRKRDDEESKPKTKSKKVKTEPVSPKKGRKSKENVKEEETKWKWWEEQNKEEGIKWKTLEHKGPVFAPEYERLPDSVNFYYDGKVLELSDEAEEVAGFYARMLDHDYTTRQLFNKNFFKDWKKVMTTEERAKITDLKKCNFQELSDFFKLKSEERKNLSKEEKLESRKSNEKIQNEYGFCVVDGHKQKIGNFKIEPPGLFRGRGEHPKQGMLKKRVRPEDVIINCSKGASVPSPPRGHKWKEVRHDNTVTWLASWSDNIQGSIKYIMLNAASRLKGEKDWMKYETARKLHKHIDKIRANYIEDFKNREMKIRQRATALYFIDKLALRAGNEKDEDTADTVGCCSLRVEHVKLHEQLNGMEHVVEFDFLGKDSIRYTNAVAVEKRVFKNLQIFVADKQPQDDLFDRLNTTILNKHLQSLMDDLSAKVFRTFNASKTLQEQLEELTTPEDSVEKKLLAYNRANRQVAILCNHQRAAPKNFDKQMENLQGKVDNKKDQIRAAKQELKDAKADYKAKKSESTRVAVEKKTKALDRLNEQLAKLEIQQTDKDENKEIALSTSKLNYLDPRISVAWCKKWNVPVEKIYNKTQREKFAWAIDMAEADYEF